MAGCYVVTGAAGFIGSHLARALLDRGDRVVGVDNYDPFYERGAKEANAARLAGPRFELVEADIRDRETMAGLLDRVGPDAICHMAALAGVRPSIQDPGRYASVNVDGLVTVLDAARGSSCQRVLFASSSSVYGNNRKVPFAETDPVEEPISPYAATKRAGELICHAYCHLFGLSVACLRLFTVYGPAQRPDLAIGKFMRLVAAGEPVPMYGDGTTSRDYTYIDDIVGGCLEAEARLRSEPEGFYRIWNLGGSQPVTLARMIEVIGEVLDRAPDLQRLPVQAGDVERTWADLARSRAELGYEPRVSFADGLRRQWAWMKSKLPVRA
ncbi:MAG: NAD-dependent epimerase/dehydratase family protein [Planctomycetota bacterium]|jgi:UDP-glucuronate 4-epimerase